MEEVEVDVNFKKNVLGVLRDKLKWLIYFYSTKLVLPENIYVHKIPTQYQHLLFKYIES